MEVKDQLNRVLNLSSAPKRIISLVPSQTELLVDLGLEACIVGLTKFCVHPVGFKKQKVIVGGTKNVKLEKIKALNPDIILCNKEENTKEIVEACEKVAPVHVSDIYTLDDAKELINQYGTLFSCENKAKEINFKIDVEFKGFLNFIKDKSIKKVAYFIWRDPWMVAANNTFINHLLTVNKFNNVYATKERYPQIELNKIELEGKLDLVLLSSEPYPFKEKHALEIKEFIGNAKVILVDGEMFSWYGGRLTKAFTYFKELHQGVF